MNRQSPTRETTMSVGHWDPRTSSKIFRELRGLDESLPDGFTLEPSRPCDLSSWRGTFPGPVGTPYEGGTFEVNIQLPAGFCIAPPRLTFLTKVWHPNVSSTNGSTCLFTTDWSPVVTLPKTLLYAHLLLCEVVPDESPHDTVVAAQYVDHREMFERTAKDWTRRYAKRTHNHHKPERYFAPRGWGEGEFGESKSDVDVVKYLVFKALDEIAGDTRKHLREVLTLVDAHKELLPEDAYLRIAKELQHAFKSTRVHHHEPDRYFEPFDWGEEEWERY